MLFYSNLVFRMSARGPLEKLASISPKSLTKAFFVIPEPKPMKMPCGWRDDDGKKIIVFNELTAALTHSAIAFGIRNRPSERQATFAPNLTIWKRVRGRCPKPPRHYAWTNPINGPVWGSRVFEFFYWFGARYVTSNLHGLIFWRSSDRRRTHRNWFFLAALSLPVLSSPTLLPLPTAWKRCVSRGVL